MKKVVILGCTGSIGDTVFKVLAGLEGEFQVIGMSGGGQVDKLAALTRCWKPHKVCFGEDPPPALRAALPGIEVLTGEQGLLELATLPQAELVINGLVGAVGLKPTLAALAAGKVVAMANKEPLVIAGGLILQTARQGGGLVLPLDSEPNALWQCLKGEDRQQVRRLILTASGGPFHGWTRERMQSITPAQALHHPTWRMGPKITIDSATLMNKGFEVIEAGWLFGVDLAQIEVVVHRESIVHSMVEFVDGAILAHLGRTDMALPIQYALTYPQRRPAPLAPLEFDKLGQLSFAAPDRLNFPCLELCYEAGRRGGTAPVKLNAANEVAVAAFLRGQLGFLDIARLNTHILEQTPDEPADSLGQVLAADDRARRQAREWIAGHKKSID